ncbi:response regulator transcription factor [Anoxynatronum sibiricum]|uniref:Stage 0 sporulation protein A homolog n=1 Tax=Anoxynatronum sibiricum TaxID=210623 RepID=A0ABU9VWH2_9CLOT
MIRIVIAEDQELLAELLEEMLAHVPDMEVVARASNGEEVIGCVRKHQPDVVLMDLRMPKLEGIEATTIIKAEMPDVKVLILTASEEEKDVREALQEGADGYLLKKSHKSELLLAVRGVFAGMQVLGNQVKQKAYSQQQISGDHGKADTIKSTMTEKDFTERELAVLKCLAEGKQPDEIASELYLSEGRIRNQITEIIKKAGVKDRTQLAIYALRLRMENATHE